MLFRALGLTPDGVPVFLYVDEIPQWGAGHVAALTGYDIVRGYPVKDGEEFRPLGETTRAEAAAFLTRYLQLRLGR